MPDIKYYDLEKGSTATPFSTASWAGMNDDWETVESQYADDIEWHVMSNNQIIKGKENVVAFLKAGQHGSQKEPLPILNTAASEWGIWEYWNTGIITKDYVEFAKQLKLPFLADIGDIVGKEYKIAVCFIYHVNAKNKIDLVREYLDMGSIMAQLLMKP